MIESVLGTLLERDNFKRATVADGLFDKIK